MLKNLQRLGLVVTIAASMLISGCSLMGNKDQPLALAKCLTDKQAIFYGTERCPHCQTQKSYFGDALSSVNYVDCDKFADQCIAAGVDSYPTWVFGDGTRVSGTQELADLAQRAGCTYGTGI